MEENKNNLGLLKTEFAKALESGALLKLLKVMGVVIIGLLIFSLGTIVGFHKATFGRSWGENYKENFAIGHRAGPLGGIANLGMTDYFPNAHGAVGEIIKIESPNIIVQDRDNTEKVVYISDSTPIEKAGEKIKILDLKLDDFVVVIGNPNPQGIIEAKLIRIMPDPEFLK